MSPFDETQPYQDDQTRPRLPDPPTAPAYSAAPPPFTLATSLPPPRRRTPVEAIALLSAGCLLVLGGLIWVLTSNHPSAARATNSGGVQTPPGTTAAPQTTATQIALVTPSPMVASCSALEEFRQAGTPDPRSRHFALTFPSQTVGLISGNDTETQSYQQRTLRLCLSASSTPLPNRLNATFAEQGWQPASLIAQGNCQAACWSQSFPVSNGAVNEIVGLSNVATQGSVQTATLTLTIVPFSSGTHTLNSAQPTFNFAPGNNSAPDDLQFTSPSSITLLDNAVYAAIPNNKFDITYGQVRALGYTNPGQPITLQNNFAVALKGNSGRISKLLVTQATNDAVTFDWVTYAYGF